MCPGLVTGGVEAVNQRVSFSLQTAAKMGLDDRVCFVFKNISDAVIRPALLAATHLHAYDKVFHDVTRDDIDGVLRDDRSRWLIYTECSSPILFQKHGWVEEELQTKRRKKPALVRRSVRQ